MQPLINIKDLSKSYLLGETIVKALDTISLTFESGGLTALMGPSGSGKSTLLNLMGALDRPSSGEIFVHGRNVAEMENDEQATFRNRTIGFIFQSFNLVPVLTTLENVTLPAFIGRMAQDATQRALDLLIKVGLREQAHQSVNRLSGGQMQRVAIARALINKPPIILADEPTANLDHKTAGNVLEVLRNLCLSERTTVIIATHDHAVLHYVDRVIYLQDGALIKDERKKV